MDSGREIASAFTAANELANLALFGYVWKWRLRVERRALAARPKSSSG